MSANEALPPGRDTASEDGLDVRVRRRIRELRVEQGLTLREVADLANIDLSTLSRLESGKRRLALDHVPALARALGVSTDDLLSIHAPADPRVRGQAVTRDGMTFWPLTRRGPAKGLHTFRLLVHAERNQPPATLPVHDGHDWLYVLDGRMRLLLGEVEHVIEAGEAVEFSTLEPHWFGAIDGPVELIGIFGAHGEQVHVSRQSP